MQKILITGFGGFVSEYLLDLLDERGEPCEVIGLSRSYHFNIKPRKNINIRLIKLDLNENDHLKEIIYLTRPSFIYHLASDSSVSYSWQNPVISFQNNTNIFLNLLESVRVLKIQCRILSVGSSEEYGIVDAESLPLQESAQLKPISPYAVARVSQEMLSKVYVNGYGMDIVMTRSFNHIGPKQRDTFVISSFAKQIVKYQMSLIKDMQVGDLSIIRDFTDVRDVVKAYVLLMEKGLAGHVYNVCTGVGYSLQEILRRMQVIAKIDIQYEKVDSLIRPSDNPVIIGSNKKIISQCEWQPVISVDQSLKDIIAYWKNELAK